MPFADGAIRCLFGMILRAGARTSYLLPDAAVILPMLRWIVDQIERAVYFCAMGKGDDTRDRILSFALARTARSGLNSVTIGSSASDLGMSKSGFFAHFGSKEALQLAVMEKAIDRFRLKVIEPSLRHPKPRQRLDALLDGYTAWMVGDDELAGCPFVLVAQEIRDCSGPVRDALIDAQESWRALLTATISAAKEDRSIVRTAPSAQIAFELIGAILSYQFAHAVLREEGASLRVSAAVSQILDKE